MTQMRVLATRKAQKGQNQGCDLQNRPRIRPNIAQNRPKRPKYGFNRSKSDKYSLQIAQNSANTSGQAKYDGFGGRTYGLTFLTLTRVEPESNIDWGGV